jgi:levansucrase
VTFYYTALGMLEPLPDDPESPTNAADGYEDVRRTGPSIARQQIVTTTAQLNRMGGAIEFQAFTPHEAILDADGDFYATAENARDEGALYVFRDPWYLEDPESDREFLLFAGAAGFQTGPKSGVVGLAVFDEERSEWRLLPPLLAGMETNSQLERPHLVHKDGRYFMFFSSHEFTFGTENPGPEGLYGFQADNLRGRYTPLNEGGLVLANPRSAPLQTYSYYVLPGGAVTSFVNYINLGDVTLEEISTQSREWQKERFGGTPAEPFYVDIASDTTTYIDGPPPARVLPAGVEAFVEALESEGS